ncbi:MAG TPA: hypothetical protein PKC73_03265, partial [Dermatophilaceae bacterium]|nr:hypothetical protein [Dermatophilaceae bacterium]
MTSAPLTPPEQALETLFSARAQRMPEDHLGVAAVLARATTLRRRRTAYRSSVALVAILAAVPLGTDLAHRWSASPSQVASGAVTGSASPPASTGAHAAWASTLTGDGAARQIALTITGLPRGEDLAVPYVTDPTAWRIVPPTGAPIALPAVQGRYGAPMRVHDGWLLPNYRTDEASSEIVRVADDGRILGRSIGRALAGSTDGRTVAYTWEGRLVRESVLDGTQTTADFPAGQVS